MTATANANAVHVVVAQWQAGGGALLVVPGWLDSGTAPWLCTEGCLFRQAERPGQQSAMAPNAPLAASLGGLNHLQLYGFDSAAKPVAGTIAVRVDALVGPPPATAKLHLNLCLTGALGITRATAPQHTRITAAVAILRDIYASIGVDVSCAFFDVKASPFVAHSADDPELSALFASGAALPMGINVFLVEQLTTDSAKGPQPISGLSGGIPGPVRQVGSAQAGVAVSLQLHFGEEDRLGVAIAHEVGHYLGLFHTEEHATTGGKPRQDQLSDTAPDATQNLMFWSPQLTSRALTAQQRAVIFDNPWLQQD